jgi:hypothetical protein
MAGLRSPTRCAGAPSLVPPCVLYVVAFLILAARARADTPPRPAEQRIASPGHATYYVHPAKGNDGNSGLKPEEAWRSFAPVNARQLAPGDRVEILAAGAFHGSLVPSGSGSQSEPVEIRFAPGEYDFFPADNTVPSPAGRGVGVEGAVKLKLHISNANDDPYTPKPVAWLFRGVRHFRITGNNADLFVHGKMVEVLVDHSEDVTFAGLAFDYRRPLVSELTVLDVAADHADVRVQWDSTYAIEKEKLVWIGEGWRSAGTALNQECDPRDDFRTRRIGSGPLTGVTRVVELSPRNLRMFFQSNPGFTAGRVLQFRETFRDCAAGLIARSKAITFKYCNFYALGGMGIVHQFSEDITYDHVKVAPRPGSGRTTCAWADMLHFSGCKGLIRIDTVRFEGSHDDPVNVHGTHLRVVGRPAANQVLVRFMHPQTYGLEAFLPGDEIEFVNHATLCSYAANKVTAAVAKSDKEILLTLEKPAPEKIGDKDVVENVTWTPSVEVRNCHVSGDSCRGFLLTTRRPIVVEKNTFLKTAMSAVKIADDAGSWFESGPARDVVIRENRFLHCGEPVIWIAPQNQTTRADQPVHKNVRIEDNYFLGGGISAKSVEGLTVTGNRFSGEVIVETKACSQVTIERNRAYANR